MAKTLTLRDVPEPVVRALRERARRNRRSMQKELLSILHGAVLDRASLVQHLASLRAQVRGGMTIEEIHAAIDEGRP